MRLAFFLLLLLNLLLYPFVSGLVGGQSDGSEPLRMSSQLKPDSIRILQADGGAVPAGRSVSLFSDRPQQSGPLYAFPLFGLLALGIAAVSLGIARGAIEDIVSLASGKRPAQGARTAPARSWASLGSARRRPAATDRRLAPRRRSDPNTGPDGRLRGLAGPMQSAGTLL